MISLQFPEPQFKTRYEGAAPQIFDDLRKKWVALTPEEWVRQNTIQWLIQNHRIPTTNISIERSVGVGGRLQRFDVLIHDRQHAPWMLIECKSQIISLNERSFLQVLRYNSSIPVKYIMITNGNQTFVADHLKNQVWLENFPDYT